MAITKSHLSNRIYNLLKYITQIALPAVGSLYFGLSQIWGFPNGEQVVGTIALITVFMGVLLGISTVNYKNSGAKYDGAIDVTESVDGKLFSLELEDDPYSLEEKPEVVLKVNKPEN